MKNLISTFALMTLTLTFALPVLTVSASSSTCGTVTWNVAGNGTFANPTHYTTTQRVVGTVNAPNTSCTIGTWDILQCSSWYCLKLVSNGGFSCPCNNYVFFNSTVAAYTGKYLMQASIGNGHVTSSGAGYFTVF